MALLGRPVPRNDALDAEPAFVWMEDGGPVGPPHGAGPLFFPYWEPARFGRDLPEVGRFERDRDQQREPVDTHIVKSIPADALEELRPRTGAMPGDRARVRAGREGGEDRNPEDRRPAIFREFVPIAGAGAVLRLAAPRKTGSATDRGGWGAGRDRRVPPPFPVRSRFGAGAAPGSTATSLWFARRCRVHLIFTPLPNRTPAMSKRLLHLVCYDVRCPRRLARVLKVVKGWSTGGQKSVHECWLTARELAALEQELVAVIDPAEDSLLILRPDLSAGVRTLGIAQKPRDPRFLYVG